MKFPIQFRGSPPKKDRSDEEIKIRISNIPNFPQDASEPVLSPKRARTVPTRRFTPPRHVASNSDGYQSIETVKYEDTILPDSNGIGQNYPKRSVSVLIKSPKQPAAITGEYRDGPAIKTPKKNSPTFSLNRNSIREPIAFVKEQGRQLFRRGTIKSLFPVTPKKIIDKLYEDSQALEDTGNKAYHRSIISKSGQSHQGIEEHNSNDFTGSRISTGTFLYHDDLSQDRHGGKHLGNDGTRLTRKDEPARIEDVSDNLENGVNPLENNQDIDSLPAQSSLRDSLIRKINKFEAARSSLDLALRPASLDHCSSPTASVTSIQTGAIAPANTPESTMDDVEGTTMDTTKHLFKSAHKNYFPRWASGLKPDGRRYTEMEIINAISRDL